MITTTTTIEKNITTTTKIVKTISNDCLTKDFSKINFKKNLPVL